jgi:hypothetical protein
MAKFDPARYPATELRQPRAHFSRKLEQICSKLDAKSTASFDWKEQYFPAQHADVQVTALWVVGSYARGAAHCGDLDLVCNFETTNRILPGMSTLTKTFTGNLPDVRVYAGSPDCNTSLAPFVEAILIWAPGMDWKAAIKNIPIDSNAGRFTRATDALPVRLEQMRGGTTEQVEKLIEAQATGTVQWQFIPFADIPLVFSPDDGAVMEATHRVSHKGRIQQELVPLILGFVTQRAKERQLHLDFKMKQTQHSEYMSFNGVQFYVESAAFDVSDLESPNVSSLVFIPKPCKRGPNGFWVIERGPAHPLTKQADATSSWVLVRDGLVDIQNQAYYVGAHQHYDSRSLLLFSTEDAAREYDESWKDSGDWTASDFKQLSGTALLDAMGGMDLVIYDDCPDLANALPLSYAGERYVKAQEASGMHFQEFMTLLLDSVTA